MVARLIASSRWLGVISQTSQASSARCLPAPSSSGPTTSKPSTPPRVAETGTHAELLAAGGVYATLYRTQFRKAATA